MLWKSQHFDCNRLVISSMCSLCCKSTMCHLQLNVCGKTVIWSAEGFGVAVPSANFSRIIDYPIWGFHNLFSFLEAKAGVVFSSACHDSYTWQTFATLRNLSSCDNDALVEIIGCLRISQRLLLNVTENKVVVGNAAVSVFGICFRSLCDSLLQPHEGSPYRIN